MALFFRFLRHYDGIVREKDLKRPTLARIQKRMSITSFTVRLQRKFARSLGVDAARKRTLSIELSKSATLFDLVYWLQLFFSSGIATLGLVLNSPAVIIGAMLISPLMGPILSAGLALATGDLILFIRSTLNLLLSCGAAILFAVVLVALLPFKEMTGEIAGRTSPNTLDLFVALFSGAIGSIATCREVKGVVTSIPGVAIAVALMPPLCVVGYGFGLALSFNFAEGMKTASGGGLLFLTNLFAITFTAMIVFLLLRIDTANVRAQVEEWRHTDPENAFIEDVLAKIPVLERARIVRNLAFRLVMILMPLAIIVFPLTTSFSKLKTEISQQQAENRIRQVAIDLWKQKFETTTSGEARSIIDDISVTESANALTVSLRVFDNVPYSEAEKNEFTRLLATQLSVPADSVTFNLIEIPTSKRDRQPFESKTPEPTVGEIHANLMRMTETAMRNFPMPSGAQVLGYEVVSRPPNTMAVRVYYLADEELSPDANDLLRQAIRERIKIPNVEGEPVFISGVRTPLVFPGNQLTAAEVTSLERTFETMRRWPNLRMDVALKGANGNGADRIEAQKRALLAVAERFPEIDSARIVFVEGESAGFRITVPSPGS